MRIREAESGDEDAISAVHERSVRELAAEHYDDAVVEAWVSPTEDDESSDADSSEERADTDDSSVGDGDDVDGVQPEDGRLFVAEVPADEGPAARTVVGFGDVRFEPPEYLEETADGGVRAVYVDPDHAGEGVGTALLRRLEIEARDEGLESLGLLASINARGFYEYHGYEPLGERTFDFGDGVEGPAVEMRQEF